MSKMAIGLIDTERPTDPELTERPIGPKITEWPSGPETTEIETTERPSGLEITERPSGPEITCVWTQEVARTDSRGGSPQSAALRSVQHFAPYQKSSEQINFSIIQKLHTFFPLYT